MKMVQSSGDAEDTKQSDGESDCLVSKPGHSLEASYPSAEMQSVYSVMLELWGMRSTTSLPLIPGPLWPGVLAPDRVLSMGDIELN